MKSINNVDYSLADFADLRSEGQLIREDELHNELEARLSDLEWIFDEWASVDWSFIDQYKSILDEMEESGTERAEKWEAHFGLYGARWECEMGWEA